MPNTAETVSVLPPKKRRFLKALFYVLVIVLLLAAGGYYYNNRPAKTTQYLDSAPLAAKSIDPFESAAARPDSPYRSDCWPGWRGYDGRGIAPHNSPPVEFGPEKAVRWKVSVPGKGYSSPIIWEQRLFLTTEIEKELYLLCFDRSDGKELWRQPIGKGLGSTHRENGFASSTSATDGTLVFSFFGATGLFCHDFEGKEIWRVDLGNLRQIHGLASSPILYKNLVIQLCDNATNSYIAAFEKTTGKEVWRTARKSGGGWSTPVVATSRDPEGKTRDELLVNGGCPGFTVQGTLISYDPATGREFWNWPGPVGWGIPTPVFSDETVFVCAGLNGQLAAIRLGGSGDVSSTNLLWARSKGSPYVPSGVLYRDRLYVPSDRERVDCFNPGNGEPVYEKKTSDNFYASLLAADGRIYALCKHGKMFVIEAGDAGKVLAETDFGEICFASPAVAEDRIFIRTETTLYCF